jgi:hypothetical protein
MSMRDEFEKWCHEGLSNTSKYEAVHRYTPPEHWNVWQAAYAAGVAAERERCAAIADEHLARVPGHNPDKQCDDLVAQGYGNAALNIADAIRRGEEIQK